MDVYEQAFVRECIRKYHIDLGIPKLNDLKSELVARGARAKAAETYKNGLGVKADMENVLPVALQLLQDKRAEIHAKMVTENPKAASYLESLLRTHAKQDGSQGGSARTIVDLVFDNWRDTARAEAKSVRTGVYQVIRRYKPSKDPAAGDQSDILVCEVVLVDAEAMECVLVTSEGRVYWGAIYVDHNKTLYAYLQRPNDRTEGAINQRFYAINIVETGDEPMGVYTGVYIKTGDITHRPLGGECVVAWIKCLEEDALYQRLKELLAAKWGDNSVRGDAAIMDYVASFDEYHAKQQVPLRIAEFPLAECIAGSNDALSWLREPSRTVDLADLYDCLEPHRSKPFRQSAREPA